MRADPARSLVILDTVRAKAPRVHCLTNSVARAFTANALLAIGAVPSMSHDAPEVGAFVENAGALLVNLGTLDVAMRAAIMTAIDAAEARELPWVLDPVFADRSSPRAVFANELLARRPAALRLNDAEAAALGAGNLDVQRRASTIIALSGKIDRISGPRAVCDIALGDPLMRRVTAMGCALGAVIAAFIAVPDERFDAVCAAVHVFGAAGSLAGFRASGPGSFVPAFLDALYNLDAKSFADAEKGR
ncbi:MAG TPA: hydroxyethylthiazole kinase [Afifellaceae bacterium]|nr:hydroxyethylthiazole kinase [Afifellaceae bacterium]